MNDNTPWAVFALVFSLFSLFVSILHHLAPEAAREDSPPVEEARAFGGEEADELAAAVVVFVPLVCALYVLTAELVQVWREDHEPDDAGDDLPPQP